MSEIQQYVSEDRTLRDTGLMRPYGNEGRSVRVVLYEAHLAAVEAAENFAYDRGVKAGRALWIDDVGGRGL